jgi:hypothetical protein
MSKRFLAIGDYLINPDLIAYAISEGSEVRIGFAAHNSGPRGELLLGGEVAREVLRWLRLNAEFLSKAGAFGSIGTSAERPLDREAQGFAHRPRALHDHGWGRLSLVES